MFIDLRVKMSKKLLFDYFNSYTKGETTKVDIEVKILIEEKHLNHEKKVIIFNYSSLNAIDIIVKYLFSSTLFDSMLFGSRLFYNLDPELVPFSIKKWC